MYVPAGWLAFCKSCGWRPAQGHIGPCSRCGGVTMSLVPPAEPEFDDFDDSDDFDLGRLRAADLGLLAPAEAERVQAQWRELRASIGGAR